MPARHIWAVLYMYVQACMYVCMEEAGSWTNIPSCLSFLRYVLCKHHRPHYKLLARDFRHFPSLVFTEYPSQILSAWCQCHVCTLQPERTLPMRKFTANGLNITSIVRRWRSIFVFFCPTKALKVQNDLYEVRSTWKPDDCFPSTFLKCICLTCFHSCRYCG